VKDFAQISVLAIVPMFVATNPSLPARSLKELIALAKAHPGKLSYGSGSSINHLAAELLKSKVPGLQIQHIPYKGSGQSVQDLIGGHIPMVMATYSSLSAHYRAGRVRVLAVLGDTRSVAAPEIPTAIESGVAAVAVSSNILSAPARTGLPVIDVVSKATLKIARDPAFQKELAELGHEPVSDSSPEQAERFVRSEIVKWTPILKANAAK
jgi:tripartite-type tricarboxylate transporter receptor subunit TctC